MRCAAGEDVEGDVQDVVGFVIGQMPLEEVEVAVDVVDQADLLSQQEDGADAAGTEALDAIGEFVVDVGGGHHGPGRSGPGVFSSRFWIRRRPSWKNLFLRACAFFSESSSHSKAPLFWNSEDVFSPLLFQKPAGFSSFFRKIAPVGVYITLG